MNTFQFLSCKRIIEYLIAGSLNVAPQVNVLLNYVEKTGTENYQAAKESCYLKSFL